MSGWTEQLRPHSYPRWQGRNGDCAVVGLTTDGRAIVVPEAHMHTARWSKIAFVLTPEQTNREPS